MIRRIQEWAADRGWGQYPPERLPVGRPNGWYYFNRFFWGAAFGVWGVIALMMGLGAIAVGGFLLFCAYHIMIGH